MFKRNSPWAPQSRDPPGHPMAPQAPDIKAEETTQKENSDKTLWYLFSYTYTISYLYINLIGGRNNW